MSDAVYSVEYLPQFRQKFHGLFQSLDRSSEAYFGRENILPMTIQKHITEIKQYVTDNYKILKNPKIHNRLFEMGSLLGNDIARILNAEECKVYFLADSDEFATIPVFTLADYRTADKKGIDTKKIAELEDIHITKEGYRFTSPKGKILCLIIGTSPIVVESVEELTGSILHELGHSMQQGIFGLYKQASDEFFHMYTNGIMSHWNNRFTKLVFGKFRTIPRILKIILKILFLPLMIFLYIPMKTLTNASKYAEAKDYAETTFKSVAEYNKAKANTVKVPNFIKQLVVSFFGADKNISKDSKHKDFKDLQQSSFKNKKSEELPEREIEFQKSKGWIHNFFKSIIVNIELLDLNTLNMLTLSRYYARETNKIGFLQKYEFFPDIFASSYGYGPDVYSSLRHMEKNTLNYIDSRFDVGLNKIPFIRAAYKLNVYKYHNLRRETGEHGTIGQRGTAMYADLQNEIKTNPDLTREQRLEIQQNLERLKEMDEAYYQEMKETGFWYNYYNKVIDDRIYKHNTTKTEEGVINLIQETLVESVKLKNKKR